MVEDKIQKLFSNEKILKEFLEQKDIEDAKKFLENRGIETSTEELKDLAKLLNEYAKKGNNITEEDLNKIVGGTLDIDRSTALNERDKCENRAIKNLICKTIPLSIVTGLTGGLAVALDDKDPCKRIIAGASIAAGTLTVRSIVKGIKNARNSCWWNRIANDDVE